MVQNLTLWLLVFGLVVVIVVILVLTTPERYAGPHSKKLSHLIPNTDDYYEQDYYANHPYIYPIENTPYTDRFQGGPPHRSRAEWWSD
jgi:hypothetical protein